MADPVNDYQSARVYQITDKLDQKYNSVPLKTDRRDGTFPDMTERLAKLEGQFEGHKLVQTITISAVGIVAAVVVAATIFLITRVNDLPGKISADIKADIRDLNQIMLQAVTASKQTPPQVMVMPALPNLISPSGANDSVKQ